jgi:mannose-6-phosphate isomerase-like protein (cupin superfamily)
MPDAPFAAPLAGRVLESPAASIVVAEWTDPGGGTDPPSYVAPLHLHHDDDEAWHVLEGVLRVRVGNRDVEVPAGGAMVVPRDTPHTYWNPSREPTRYLLIMTPTIRRLIDALHAPGDRDERAVRELFREHRSSFLGWPEG